MIRSLDLTELLSVGVDTTLLGTEGPIPPPLPPPDYSGVDPGQQTLGGRGLSPPDHRIGPVQHRGGLGSPTPLPLVGGNDVVTGNRGQW